MSVLKGLHKGLEALSARGGLWAAAVQFLKFGVVGLSNTLISLAVYYVFVWIDPALYLWGNAAGWVVSVLNAFYWNNRVVFGGSGISRGERLTRLMKSYVSYGGTFLLSTLILELEISQWGVSEWLAPIVNLLITIPLNFLINKFWTFRKREKNASSAAARRERRRWLTALLMVMVLTAAACIVSHVVFQTNDDNAIAAAASGGVTGEPYAGNGFTSYLYGALLAALYRAVPAVPWHGALLWAVQFLSLAAVLRSAFFLCDKHKIAPLWGAAGFAALYFGVGLKFMVHLQFTATPGYCAAALAALIWTLPEEKNDRRFCCALGFSLAAFGLLLRFRSGLMTLPVPLMLAAVRMLGREAKARTLLPLCAALAVFAVAAWAVDGVLYRANEPDWEAQEAFDKASAALMDYHNDDASYELALEVTDWSPELIRCIRNWNLFLDERFNTENLTKLAAAIEDSAQSPTVLEVFKKTGSVIKRYHEFAWNALAMALLGVWVFCQALREKKKWHALLVIALGGSAAAVIAFFYGWQNRFPDRVAFAYAWPVYVAVWTLFLEACGMRERNTRDAGITITNAASVVSCADNARTAAGIKVPTLSDRRRTAGLGVLMMVLAALATVLPNLDDTLVPRWEYGNRTYRADLTRQVNAYAAAHPDNLYVTDVTQGFYAFSTERAPVNLLDWGSAMIRSPMYARKMACLGYPNGLTSKNLADRRVRLIFASPASLGLLMDCVNADIAPWAAVEEDDPGRFKVYRLEAGE